MLKRSTVLLAIGFAAGLDACGHNDGGSADAPEAGKFKDGGPIGLVQDANAAALPGTIVVEQRGRASTISFDDVVGATEAKLALQDFAATLAHPDRDRHLGVRPARGILLVGPPGTGKTMLARATADAIDASLFSVTGPDLLLGGFGASGSDIIHALFSEARSRAPSVVFIDEIDVLGFNDGVLAKQLGTEMDGFSGEGEVYVIAAGNSVRYLPDSLLRAGRFDRVAYVPLPNVAARAEILRKRTKNTSLADDVDLEEIAFLAEGMSGADLVNLANTAGLRAAGAHKQAVDASDWEEALVDIQMGPVDPSREHDETNARITAVHEAGHAVLATLLDGVMRVHRVTTLARGESAGHTSFYPLKNPPHAELGHWRDQIAISLAGQAAEAEVLRQFGPGAQADLQHATRLARATVTHWGMNKAIGPVDLLAINNPFVTPIYADSTRAKVDEEVSKLIAEEMARVRDLLHEHVLQVERVAQALSVCQTISGNEVRTIVSGGAVARCQVTMLAPAD